jgi:hypothetical protein
VSADDGGKAPVEVREVAGLFRSAAALESAVETLLAAGFDGADIDLLANTSPSDEEHGSRTRHLVRAGRDDGFLTTVVVAGTLFVTGAMIVSIVVPMSGGEGHRRTPCKRPCGRQNRSNWGRSGRHPALALGRKATRVLLAINGVVVWDAGTPPSTRWRCRRSSEPRWAIGGRPRDQCRASVSALEAKSRVRTSFGGERLIPSSMFAVSDGYSNPTRREQP